MCQYLKSIRYIFKTTIQLLYNYYLQDVFTEDVHDRSIMHNWLSRLNENF